MKKMFARLWGTLLAGLLVLLPLVITVAIAVWLIDFVKGLIGGDTIIGKALESLGANFVRNETTAPLVGWAIVIGATFLLGLLAQSQAKHFIRGVIDGLFKRIPIFGSVYGTAAQFVKMLDKSDKTELSGMSVVFCKFGEESGMGLLALMPSADEYTFNGRAYNIVYIPTAPVPMTGGLLYVPADCTTQLEMSVDSLMSVYLSMGISAPTIPFTPMGNLPSKPGDASPKA